MTIRLCGESMCERLLYSLKDQKLNFLNTNCVLLDQFKVESNE